MGKIFGRGHFDTFFNFFFPRKQFDISYKLSPISFPGLDISFKLSPGKIRKNITDLLSAEFADRVVNVKPYVPCL